MLKVIAILLALTPALFHTRTAQAEERTIAASLAGEAPVAHKYFEPTVDEWNCCAKDIRAQQARYAAARDKKDYEGARAEAIWNFQIAWQYNNEANALLSSKAIWEDKEKIKDAIALLDKAEASLEADAKLKEHADDKRAIHARDIVKCQEKIDANRKAANDQIKALEKAGK